MPTEIPTGIPPFLTPPVMVRLWDLLLTVLTVMIAILIFIRVHKKLQTMELMITATEWLMNLEKAYIILMLSLISPSLLILSQMRQSLCSHFPNRRTFI